MPSWYLVPDYAFAVLALAGVMLRDRWLATTALILTADAAVTWAVSTNMPHEYGWAYKAIADLATALVIAWPGKPRAIIVASLVGAGVTGYLIIGASLVFGDDYAQAYINYHTWYCMTYLAFAIVGALALGGFEDHGGKRFRHNAVGYFRGDRRPVLEAAHSHREISHRPVESEIGRIYRALLRLYKIN